MRLRIISGDVTPGAPAGESLARVFEAPGLAIEASADVRRYNSASGAPAFVSGDVLGLVAPNGEMNPASSRADISEMLHDLPAAACRERFEGRYLAAVVRADGGCDIFSDTFGKRDLYVQRVGGAIVAASDLALLPVATTPGTYDPVALAHVLTVFGWRPAKKQTLYRDVSRLGVGETLRVERGTTTITAAPFEPVRTAPFVEADLHRYADLLIDAVNLRASRHGNVVYLSSGWDSTAILACLVHLFGPRKIRAVIGRMRYSERRGVVNQFEIDRATAVADYYKVPLEIVEFDYRQSGPDLIERLGPRLRSHQVASLTALSHGYLAEHVARTSGGDESVFAGEISDGVHNLGFSQYATIFHPVLEFREYSDKMASYLFGPTFFQSLSSGTFVHDPIYRWIKERCGADGFDDWTAGPPADQARRLFASFFLRPTRVPMWSLKGTRLLTDHGREMYSQAMEEEYLAGPASQVTPETLYAWYLRLYNSFHWQGSTVASMGVTAEESGLRLVLPFWDSRLHAFLSAMPESWGRGLDLNPTKYPLKWALKNRIRYPNHLQTGPHSYLYDVDHGFNHAIEVLYHSAFTPFFTDRLKARAYRGLLPDDVIDLAFLDSVVTKYLVGTEVTGAELGALVSVAWITASGWYGQ